MFLFFRGFAILVKNKKLEKTERRVLATTLICVLVAKSLFFLAFGGFGYVWSKTKRLEKTKKNNVLASTLISGLVAKSLAFLFFLLFSRVLES